MVWGEQNRVDYLFGLARTPRLVEHIAIPRPGPSTTPRRPASRPAASPISAGRRGRAGSRRRRVVAKAEWMPGRGDKGANPRFVVTSLKPGTCDARTLYERMYCARGEMENRIKECQPSPTAPVRRP